MRISLPVRVAGMSHVREPWILTCQRTLDAQIASEFKGNGLSSCDF